MFSYLAIAAKINNVKLQLTPFSACWTKLSVFFSFYTAENKKEDWLYSLDLYFGTIAANHLRFCSNVQKVIRWNINVVREHLNETFNLQHCAWVVMFHRKVDFKVSGK